MMIRPRFVNFLILAVLTDTCLCAGRQFITTRLVDSPVGIGFKSALNDSRRFSSRNRRSHKYDATTTTKGFSLFCDDDGSEDHVSRHAAVSANEMDALRRAETPTIKSKKGPSKHSNDELYCLESRLVLPCARLHAGRHHRHHHHQQQQQQVIDASSTSLARSMAAHPPNTIHTSDTRGGTVLVATRSLFFWENMLGGAISRSVAQTVMHPANTMKTILQNSRGPDRITFQQLFRPSMFKMLTRGAGANFLLSVPHGAVNFAVLELVRAKMNTFVSTVPFLAERLDSIGPALDFTSSAVSTICCSVVSTPQMMITDNIMAGNYPNLGSAIKGLYTDRGIGGFYAGWWPGLVGKIPSYALTWTFFQQLKRVRDMMSDRPAKNIENTAMGCIASAATVCIMIPLDTVKTRLVAQTGAKVAGGVPYKGIVDCAVRVAQEEGIATFYRGLAPRLISVVPMIGIQFGVYEFMKKMMLQRTIKEPIAGGRLLVGDRYGAEEALEEAAMETAASQGSPFPAPHFLKKLSQKKAPTKKKRWSRGEKKLT